MAGAVDPLHPACSWPFWFRLPKLTCVISNSVDSPRFHQVPDLDPAVTNGVGIVDFERLARRLAPP